MMNIQDGSANLNSDKIIETTPPQSLFQLGYRIKFALILFVILFMFAGVSYLVKIHHSPSLVSREITPLRYSSNKVPASNHLDNPSYSPDLSIDDFNLSSTEVGEGLNPEVKAKIQGLFLPTNN